MAKKKHRKILNITIVSWLFLLVAMILFGAVMSRLEFLPFRWRMIVIVASLLVAVISLKLSLIRHKAKVIEIAGRIVHKKPLKRYIMSVINTVLASAVLIATFFIHNTNRSFEQVFNENNVAATHMYEIVALKSEYKKEHTDIFANTETEEDIKKYGDKKILAQSASDQTNQNKAIEWINKKIDMELNFEQKKSISEIVDALYLGEADAILISETYKSAFKNFEKYKNFENETIVLATINIEEEIIVKPKAEETAPFSIYIAGNDEYGELLSEGRFDVNMLVTVNPKTRQVLIGSFARDSYIPNVALGSSYDKLTHTGVMGVQNSVDSINYYFGTNATDYVIVNFSTFLTIIDTIGGVQVENPEEFTAYWTGNYYPAGTISLDSVSALEYVRERYNLPDGDFGRNTHQQIVLKAIIQKLTSPSMIPNFANVLASLSGTFITSVDISLINQLASQTLEEGIQWDIITTRIAGVDGMDYCASAPNELLSVVYPDIAQVNDYISKYNQLMSGQMILTEETAAVDTPPADDLIGKTVTVNVDVLNIRNAAGISGVVVGSVSRGQSFTVLETMQADGYSWYRIAENQWIADQNNTFLMFK